MKDRVPLYPGRVKLTPVSGQENTYDMVRADEPTQEGDPLSKATFLKDDTAALYGLNQTAVPDDLFRMLSNATSATVNVTGFTEDDTVVATKDGLTVNGVWDGTQHVLKPLRPLGTWTITVTRGALNATQDVLLDLPMLYTISMSYKLWLYNESNEYPDVTGGWVQNGSHGGYQKNDDSMQFSYNRGYFGLKTSNRAIANPGLNTLHALVRSTATTYDTKMGIYLSSGASRLADIGNSADYFDVSINISDVNTLSFGVTFYGDYVSSSSGTVFIKKVWLE